MVPKGRIELPTY